MALSADPSRSFARYPTTLARRGDQRRLEQFSLSPAMRDALGSVWLGVLAIALIPFTSAILWWVSYGLYASAIPFVLYSFARNDGRAFRSASWFVWANIIALIGVILFYAGDASSVVNLASLLMATVALAWSFNSAVYDDSSRTLVFRLILAAVLFAVCGGTVASFVLSYAGLLWDPLTNFIANGRFIILAPVIPGLLFPFGHSIAVHYGFVILLLCASNVVALHSTTRYALIAFSVALLLATGASISLILLSFMLIVWAIENVVVTPWRRYVCYAIIFAVLIIAAVQPDVLQAVMGFIRLTVQGKEDYLYGDDFSAGRALLNKLLIEAIQRSPLLGVGHNDPLMQIGTAVVTGDFDNAAGVESGLRMAAQYGLPYFLTTVALALSPLRLLTAESRAYRICGAGLTVGVLAYSGANGIQVAHEPDFVIFVSLMILLGCPGLLGERQMASSLVPRRG